MNIKTRLYLGYYFNIINIEIFARVFGLRRWRQVNKNMDNRIL
jgi:hypothetical protein